MYTRSIETIYLSLRAQVAVGTFSWNPQYLIMLQFLFIKFLLFYLNSLCKHQLKKDNNCWMISKEFTSYWIMFAYNCGWKILSKSNTEEIVNFLFQASYVTFIAIARIVNIFFLFFFAVFLLRYFSSSSWKVLSLKTKKWTKKLH